MLVSRIYNSRALGRSIVVISAFATAVSVVVTPISSADSSLNMPALGYIRHDFRVPYEVNQSWIRRDMKFEGLNAEKDFWMFNSIFPKCFSEQQEACIEEVFERDSDSGVWSSLNYLEDLNFSRNTWTTAEGQIVDVGPFQGRPENLLPEGGRPSIWKSKSGNLRVSVGIDGGMRNGRAWNMMARISISGLDWEMKEQSQYRLIIRMGRWLSSVQGFLQGHLANPQIELISPLPRGTISISGSPVRVTEVTAINRFEDLAREMISSLDDGGYEYNQGLKGKSYVRPRDWNAGTPSKTLEIASDNGYGLYKNPETIMPFRNLEPFFVKESLHDVVVWRIRTPWAWDKDRSCYTENPKGPGFRAVISTNATVYEVELPEIDDNDSFVIQVGSPSTDEKGLRKTGTYHLAIEESLARCLWKRELLPTQVQLRISYTDGREEISTLSVTKREGFLYLSSIGFNYSSPTLTFKLPSLNSTTITSLERTESSSSKGDSRVGGSVIKTKKIVISCKKGDRVKKVVGVKAQCPRGYKKV